MKQVKTSHEKEKMPFILLGTTDYQEKRHPRVPYSTIPSMYGTINLRSGKDYEYISVSFLGIQLAIPTRIIVSTARLTCHIHTSYSAVVH